MTETQLRETIVEVGRRLYARGYTASNDGNISTRLDDRRLLMTPKSVCKGFMSPDMMVVTDLDGKKLAGDRDPSSEMQMHLEVYRQRPDARAVVHAHPPIATGFAVAGQGFDAFVLPELILQMGRVPVVPYGTPGTPELGDRVEPFIAGHEALLLANHGAVTVGATLDAAWIRMESLEHCARIIFAARALGGPVELSGDAVARLEAQRAAARREPDA